jgi:hypothetical protein
MKKYSILFFGFMVILITGCGTPGKWMKEGTNQRDYSRDFAKCTGLTSTVKGVDAIAFHRCMHGEGWDWVVQGKSYGSGLPEDQ